MLESLRTAKHFLLSMGGLAGALWSAFWRARSPRGQLERVTAEVRGTCPCGVSWSDCVRMFGTAECRPFEAATDIEAGAFVALDPNGRAVPASGYRYLGNRAVSPAHSVLLHCDHCMVSWSGCAAESFCPRCHAPKGFYPHDLNVCFCDRCRPHARKVCA